MSRLYRPRNIRRSLAFALSVLVTLALLLSAASCKRSVKDKQGIDWSVTLDHTKKTPYAASLVYETLPQYFPGAKREALSRWFRYTSIDERMYGSYDSASLLVLLGLSCFVTDDEWNSILKFAKAGNEVFLLSSNLDVHFARALHCEKESGRQEEYPLSRYNDGTASRSALKLLPDSSFTFGYVGRTITAAFKPGIAPEDPDTLIDGDEYDSDPLRYERYTLEQSIDTLPVTLGVAKGKPNFLRYAVGDGHITLHAAPLVLSNYFLLQQGNRAYLDAIWHSFPANISTIYWNEYYKRSTKGSSLSVLLKYPAIRWALIVAACTLLLYVLFGLKRLQRVVPIIPPLENASVSFVETIGRLYFNKGNHGNLAEKMVQHFLEWVRNKYYLDTTQLGDAFVRQLAAKSGKGEEETAVLVNRIHDIRLGTAVTPESLYQLHNAIQSFYKAR